MCRRAAFLRDACNIDVGDDELGLAREAFAFGNLLAHLVGDDLAVPGKIGGAFAVAGGGEHVSGDGAARLAVAKHGAVLGFADDDVRGREIEQNVGARKRAYRRWRRRRPEVFADLDVEGEIGIVGCGEDDSSRRSSTQSPHRKMRSLFGVAGDAEVALLVELAIVRQKALWHDAEDFAAMDDDRAIVKRAARADRRADDQDGEKLFALRLAAWPIAASTASSSVSCSNRSSIA